MRKLLLLCFLVLSSIKVLAQRSTEPVKNSVKANPLGLLFGSPDLLSYERAISDHSTLLLGLGYSSLSVEDLSYKAKGINLQYRYYFKEAIKDWYVLGSVASTSGKLSSSSESIEYSNILIGSKAGYQWVWESGFSLDLGGGFNYVIYDYDLTGVTSLSESSIKANGVVLSLGFGLGYSW